ncbi:MAG: ABC transporter ATP-binding protein [Firmicutes bacterium]|nr:ABC transporter ATP-binding protein [Bacillota bacterium]
MNNSQEIKAAIEVENLSKRYEEVQAVDKISFTVKRGEIFGFLGPNGAGKTTTINMLTGLNRISSGQVKINGQTEIKKVQEAIGIVPSESNLYPELDGFENLCFCASLYGLKKGVREREARYLLEKFNLAEVGGRTFGAYSKGMKRKLTIAAGIIHKPEILFLDEPTTGIDVASARQIRRLIIDLNRAGTTIFLTTHYIEEAERLCDRVAFIVKGRIKYLDTTENLLDNARQDNIIEFLSDKKSLQDKEIILKKLSDYQVELFGEKIRIHIDRKTTIDKFINIFNEIDCNIYEARLLRPSLEDVFVKITGIEVDEMEKDKAKGGR